MRSEPPSAAAPGYRLGRIRVGTSSWTDKTLLESGWYPEDAKTPEDRLRFYASQFHVVEVDSTYYALHSERNAVLWIERTPKDFVFNIKAFSLMTRHPTSVRGLPRAARELLPEDAPQRLYPKDIPSEVADMTWEMFRTALMPLQSAGKLGVVMFQFPQWFMPNRESKDYILSCRERLPDYDIAIEFRQGTWFGDEDATRRTLEFLRREEIPFVCVDMPQGFASSIPPIAEATSDRLALMRFHGRRSEVWGKRGVPVIERFKYDYAKKELNEWVPRIEELGEKAKETHVLFNNCYRDYATKNAKQFAGLLPDE
jgi:uncharacterized protein YecE (DUF72 family)